MITLNINDNSLVHISGYTVNTLINVDPYSQQYKFLFDNYNLNYDIEDLEWHLYLINDVVTMYNGVASSVDDSVTFYIDLRNNGSEVMQLFAYTEEDNTHQCITIPITLKYKSIVYLPD